MAAQLYEAQREDAERFAAGARQQIERPGLVASSEVVLGRAASVILDAAERFEADLLVVGSRGRGPFTSALLGSVSEEVIDHALRPVLVARGSGLTRVLLADDGSKDARAAAELLTSWPIFRASQVRVMSVAEPAGEAGPPAPMDVLPSDESEEASLQRRIESGRLYAEQTARTTADRLRAAGLAVKPQVRQGDPATAIVADAGAWPADLIVIGTRGQTGLTRLLRGSIARKVLLHAHCSVLIQRQRSAG